MKVKKYAAFVLAVMMAGTLGVCRIQAKTVEGSGTAFSEQTEAMPAEDIGFTGGWEINRGEVSLGKNKTVEKAFKNAVAKLVGADYEAIAYLGSQTVAGTNYLILCRITPITPDAEPSYSLVTVYENLEGESEIWDVQDLDIAIVSENTDISVGVDEQIPAFFVEAESIDEV